MDVSGFMRIRSGTLGCGTERKGEPFAWSGLAWFGVVRSGLARFVMAWFVWDW